MAKVQVSVYVKKSIKRKGVHSKKKTSGLKSSKLYKKKISWTGTIIISLYLLFNFKTYTNV